MFDPRTLELVSTVLGCGALLALWVGAAMVLPWSEDELNEVSLSFAALRGLARPAPVRVHAIAREVVPR